MLGKCVEGETEDTCVKNKLKCGQRQNIVSKCDTQPQICIVNESPHSYPIITVHIEENVS